METERSKLSIMVKEYIKYTLEDSSLSQRERESALAKGASLFLGLSRFYGDQSTIEYILGQNFTSKRSNYEQSPKTVNSASRSPSPIVRKNLSLKKQSPLREMTNNQNEIEGFRSLDQVMRILRVDRKTLMYILDQISFPIETREVGGEKIDYVSDESFTKIRRYVRQIRSV